jgi:hypothetical protein
LFLEDDDDDLFLYEEDDFLDDKEAIVAFGDNEMIEALIIILSHLFSRSLKLFCFYTQSMIYICDVWSSFNEFYFKILVVSFFFLSLFCLSVCGLDLG